MAPKITKVDPEILKIEREFIDPEILKIEREFIQAFGAMWSRWGFSRTSGLILGALYLADADIPLTQGDLASLLHVSRSTLSAALTELQGVHLIRSTKSIGSRQEHYTTLTDPRELLLEAFRMLKRRDIEPVLSASKYSSEKAESVKTNAVRLRGVRDRIHKVRELYTDLNTWMTEFGKLNTDQFQLCLRIPHDKLVEIAEQMRGVEGEDSGAA